MLLIKGLKEFHLFILRVSLKKQKQIKRLNIEIFRSQSQSGKTGVLTSRATRHS